MRTLVSFGAVGNGIVDDTAAVQAAANFGGLIDVQDKQYLIKSHITVSKPTRFVGDGKGNCAFLVWHLFTDPYLFLVSPTVGLNPYGYSFENLSFNPETNTQTDPIAVYFATTTAGQFLLMPEILRCSVGLTNAIAIASVNNNPDGLACLQIKGNVLNGGIFLNLVGDNTNIDCNVISGPGLGIYSTFASGANLMTVTKNNITNKDGGLYLVSPINTRVMWNQFEPNQGYTGGVGAYNYIQGGHGCTFSGNQTQAETLCDALFLNGTHDFHYGADNTAYVGTLKFHFHLIGNTGLNMDATNIYYTNFVEGAATSH